jgi:hypothetical protein
VLGYQVETPPLAYSSWSNFSEAVGGNGEAWAAVIDPDGAGPRVLFHKVSESKVSKNRVHLDVRVASPHGTPKKRHHALVDAEVTRLLGAGATHVCTDDDETDYFAVMQDPEGNEFCVC